MHYESVLLVARNTSNKWKAQAMRAAAPKYDCDRLTEGECTIIMTTRGGPEATDKVVSIMIVGEGQRLEDGAQGGGGEIIEETWKP